jgi:ABC-type Fe3+-siderophore transport system permease subunit
MAKSRATYFILIVVTIVIGLLSRHYSFIPAFIGDILWALMVYFMVRFIFINKSNRFTILASAGFCYAIEFSQLYKAPWIDSLRQTLFGRLVLGSTFLWSDLLCYTVGIILGVLVDKKITHR